MLGRRTSQHNDNSIFLLVTIQSKNRRQASSSLVRDACFDPADVTFSNQFVGVAPADGFYLYLPVFEELEDALVLLGVDNLSELFVFHGFL